MNPLPKSEKAKAKTFAPDTAAHQNIAEHLGTIAAIRFGLAQAKNGQGRPVDQVFDELENEPLR